MLGKKPQLIPSNYGFKNVKQLYWSVANHEVYIIDKLTGLVLLRGSLKVYCLCPIIEFSTKLWVFVCCRLLYIFYSHLHFLHLKYFYFLLLYFIQFTCFFIILGVYEARFTNMYRNVRRSLSGVNRGTPRRRVSTAPWLMHLQWCLNFPWRI